MFSVSLDDFTLYLSQGRPPCNGWIADRATFFDDLANPAATVWYWLALERTNGDVPVSVLLTADRDSGPETMGVHLIVETQMLLVGFQDRLLCYDIRTPRRRWLESVFWFHRWTRHDDVVLMQSEYELAAYSLSGDRRWRTQADRPYRLKVQDGTVKVLSEGDGYVPPDEFSLWYGPHA